MPDGRAAGIVRLCGRLASAAARAAAAGSTKASAVLTKNARWFTIVRVAKVSKVINSVFFISALSRVRGRPLQPGRWWYCFLLTTMGFWDRAVVRRNGRESG